jgi:hypothetical protein
MLVADAREDRLVEKRMHGVDDRGPVPGSAFVILLFTVTSRMVLVPIHPPGQCVLVFLVTGSSLRVL